ncbi:unnamed protein product [Sphagnum jensenii]|uniref:S1 motif domain-containing protein n=1 Tax=Sphagnum jensenii TaxID=128206 RepID=A0ABP1A698_9BRYO
MFQVPQPWARKLQRTCAPSLSSGTHPGSFHNFPRQRQQRSLLLLHDNSTQRKIVSPTTILQHKALLGSKEISNVSSNMDINGTEGGIGALSLSVHLQRPIKLNVSSSSPQTISPPVEDSNDKSSSINSQEPSDDAFHIIPHHVAVEKQGNLVADFDHNLTKGAAAEEMPEMERRIQESRLQEHQDGGGGLIHPSQQHTFDRESEDNELHAHDDDAIEYYVPSVGDIVIGVVVFSNHSKLDIDIGAQKLGHMFIKDLISLGQLKLEEACWKIPNDDDRSLEGPHVPPPPLGQPCVVHDDKEVLRTEIQTPSSSPVVELGTVFVMEVKGETMSGRPLLSARSVARGFAWKRIRQIRELNQAVEIQITHWNPTGLVSRIEGIRAFLPVYHLFKQSSQASLHSLKDYVGRYMCVTITAFDEKTCNLIISEKQAWKMKNLHPGALVDGIVIDIHKFGARIKIKETDISGLLHISKIARARIHDIRDVFSIREQVKVMVVKSPIKNGIAFSTADLESEDGLMLTDKERVYREAEEMAKAFRDTHRVQENTSVEYGFNQDWSDFVEEEKPIANWDWLDFGGK